MILMAIRSQKKDHYGIEEDAIIFLVKKSKSDGTGHFCNATARTGNHWTSKCHDNLQVMTFVC